MSANVTDFSELSANVADLPESRDARPRWQLAALAIAVSATAIGWAIADHRDWRRLGVGGLPPTWRGWLQTTIWRTMKRSPFDVTLLKALAGGPDCAASLADLPWRTPPRPRVGPHPVPHRQLSHHATPAARKALKNMFDSVVRDNAHCLAYLPSHYEKHCEAVTLIDASYAPVPAAAGEIGHIHASDGSMHMIFRPSDAIIVIERGWGELHGLAGIALGLPTTYTLVYAPRDVHETTIIVSLLIAAVEYMAGSPV